MANPIGPKGQVVIPKEYRDRLGLKPGSAVSFRLRPADNVLEIQPAWADPITDGPAIIQRLAVRQASEQPATDTLLEMRREDDQLWHEQIDRLSRKR